MVKPGISHAVAGLLLLAGTSGAMAQQAADAPPRAPVLAQLYECRAITDPAARLACFDTRVAAVESAEAARDIRVIDRAQVRETRRGLFGLSLNLGSLFGGDDNEQGGAEGDAGSDVVQQIEGTLASVSRGPTGRIVYVLDNGQRWVQTDNPRGRTPRAGQPIVIRRGSLGSFIANIDGRAGVRVMRER